MKEWFDSLAPRERIMVSAAAVVAVLAILYLAVWQPLNAGVDSLHKQVRQQKQLVNWLHEKAPEIRAMRTRSRHSGSKARSGSMLSVISNTSDKLGLRGAIQRIQPQNDQLVQIWVEDATFNDVVTWLHRLGSQYGISVKSLDLKPAGHVGQVSGNMRLYRPKASGT